MNLDSQVYQLAALRAAKKQKRDDARVIAKLKGTNSLVVLASMRELDVRIHELFIPDAVVVPVQAPVVTQVAGDKAARLQELKDQRAWLKKDLKEEYNALKLELNG